MDDLEKQMRKAQRQGDDVEASVLQKQMQNLSNTLAQERLAQLKAGAEGLVDPAMIDLIAAWTTSFAATNLEASQKLMRDMAERMGRLPGTDRGEGGAADRFSARSGFVSSKGRSLHLSLVSFTRISDGAPALTDWLCAKGATAFTYDIAPRTSLTPEEEE